MGQKKPEREQTEETKQSRWGFRGKTVWDWLPIVGALLVPLVIALGTGWITRACYELGRKPHIYAVFAVALVPLRSPFPAFLSRF